MNEKTSGYHVKIDYTNWRGRRSKRLIQPLSVEFSSNEYHPIPQWLLTAIDITTGKPRTFALKDIHSWIPA